MLKSLKTLLLTFTTSILLISNVFAQEYSGTVLSNHDGDTLLVQIGNKKEKVRLLGVDTAEIAQGYWGSEAQKFTEKTTKGKEVKLETDVQERDKYGRLLAYVYINNVFLNELLVKEGYAQLLTYAPNVKYVDKLKKSQEEAKIASKGIWGKNGLKETPYEFRHKGTKQPKSTKTTKIVEKPIDIKISKSSKKDLVHVNKNSGVYHFSGCEHYNCRNCVIEITEEEAIVKGYHRHCK
ncbi:MAG: thermonuclease family protein [Candidatus Sericytochromatia bacterium]